VLKLRGRTLELAVPAVAGIVNLNADSFSDPGPRTDATVEARLAAVVAEGADLVELGAQSAITDRPPVDAAVEAELVARALATARRRHPEVVLAVDTYKLEVVEAALAGGCHLVNDISGLADLGVAEACGRAGAGLVVTHTPVGPLAALQDESAYGDVAGEVAAWLARALARAEGAGADRRSLVVDPGVDLAKTPSQTLALLRDLHRIAALGRPILLAVSRKDFVGALTRRSPAGRGPGTLGAVAALRGVGRQILRVHDVAATRDLLAVYDALRGPPPPGPLAVPHELRHEPQPRVSSGPAPPVGPGGGDR